MGSRPNLRYHATFHLHWMRKTTTTLNHNGRYPGQDFNPEPPKIQSWVICTWPQSLVEMVSTETEKQCALDISAKCLVTQNYLQQNLSPYQAPGCYLVTSQFLVVIKVNITSWRHHLHMSKLANEINMVMCGSWECRKIQRKFTQKPHYGRNNTTM
jgi:hypothetical protein